MKFPRVFLMAVIAGSLVSLTSAQITDPAQIDGLISEIVSVDPNVPRKTSLTAMYDYLNHATPKDVKTVLCSKGNGKWLGQLTDQKQYAEVLKLTEIGLGCLADDLNAVESLMQRRVVATLAIARDVTPVADHPAAVATTRPAKLPAPPRAEVATALAEAKSYFNVCSMKNTSKAIQYLAEAFKLAYPDMPDVVPEFKRQQLAGSTTQPMVPAVATQPAPRAPATYLTQIAVEAKVYNQALKNYLEDDYRSLNAKGNLLLLADKPTEAMQMFTAAYQIAPDKELAPATENIARALRAQDGTIGRANSFVLAVRPPATQPAR